MSHSLVVDLTFNSPEIKIVGPVQETTISHLNEVLPAATTSTRSIRHSAPVFQRLSNPEHWKMQLTGQFCDAEGISRVMVLLLDALEEEGGWTLVSSQASSARNGGVMQQEFMETYKLFFSKYED